MVNIVESLDEFQEMSFDAQLAFIADWLVETTRAVTALARKIAVWYEGINEEGKQVKALVKAVHGIGVRKGVVTDILKGDIDFRSELFKKEGDAVKEYLKDLERKVMYI